MGSIIVLKPAPPAMTVARVSHRIAFCWAQLLIAVALSLALAGCGLSAGDRSPQAAIDTRSITEADALAGPKVAKGDKLRINVFNEPELSGEFTVSETGMIAFPLIGQIEVANLSGPEIQQLLRRRLSGKYLVDPKVSVDLLTQRPFYILGAVRNAGEYPYRPGLNVIGAIATAGGFSLRANKDVVRIRRGNAAEQDFPVEPGVAIYPGDMITVPDRIF